MENIPKDKKIVLFDGICSLCERSVQFIIKNDTKDQFRFAPIQSEIGQQLLRYLGVDPTETDSIILYVPGEAYYCKAEAVFQIAKALKSWHRLIGWFSFTGSFANVLYDYIAKNRYKWYEKKETCLVPSKEVIAKFL